MTILLSKIETLRLYLQSLTMDTLANELEDSISPIETPKDFSTYWTDDLFPGQIKVPIIPPVTAQNENTCEDYSAIIKIADYVGKIMLPVLVMYVVLIVRRRLIRRFRRRRLPAVAGARRRIHPIVRWFVRKFLLPNRPAPPSRTTLAQALDDLDQMDIPIPSLMGMHRSRPDILPNGPQSPRQRNLPMVRREHSLTPPLQQIRIMEIPNPGEVMSSSKPEFLKFHEGRRLNAADLLNQNTCVICLENFRIGERVPKLKHPCIENHNFMHRSCLEKWFQHGASAGKGPQCPICRKTIQ